MLQIFEKTSFFNLLSLTVRLHRTQTKMVLSESCAKVVLVFDPFPT
jgi:hypothetical protein